MSKEQTSIGPWLYWSLMLITTLSYGMLNLPYYSTRFMGANAYLAVPFAAILVLPGLVVIYLLMKRFPGLNLIQVGIKILGPIFGRLLGLGYLLFVVILLVNFTRDTVNLIHVYFMDNTPLLILGATYLLIAAYLASRGLETISRLASFVVLPAITVMALLLIGVLPNIEINRLRPVLNLEFKSFFIGGFSILNAFYPLGLIALINPYLSGIRKKLPRLTLYGGVMLIGLFMLISIGAIGIFGHEYLDRFAYPGLEAIHSIEFPYLLIEQAGLLMVLNWITIIMVGSGFIYYSLALGMSQVTGFLDYKRWVKLLIPIKLILIMLPRNVSETKQILLYIARYGWIPLFGFPVLLYLTALILKKGVGGNKA